MKTWFTRIHTLKPTQKELAILWGQPIHSDADRVLAVNSLHQQGVKRILFAWKMNPFLQRKDGEQFY